MIYFFNDIYLEALNKVYWVEKHTHEKPFVYIFMKQSFSEVLRVGVLFF